VRERSAGILMYRRGRPAPEFFLVHPGGPFWARKDAGAWSIPKGICDPGEEPLAAAEREFAEETGFLPTGEFVPLGEFRQRSGKIIIAWALEGDVDPTLLRSNLFTMEWPPKSGKQAEFPEVDRGAWFAAEVAADKIVPGQRPILAALLARLDRPRLEQDE
jgi:predicted NUDIX family NTP pyrophosphohydrolase